MNETWARSRCRTAYSGGRASVWWTKRRSCPNSARSGSTARGGSETARAPIAPTRAKNGLPVRRRVILHTARSQNRVIQQPPQGGSVSPRFIPIAVPPPPRISFRNRRARSIHHRPSPGRPPRVQRPGRKGPGDRRRPGPGERGFWPIRM